MQHKNKGTFSKSVLLPLLLVGCFQFSFAQSDTVKVGKNKTKIDELNQRLDNLAKSTETINKGDSIEIKLNLLLRQMAEVKQEVSTMKTAIKTMSEENRQAFEELSNWPNNQDLNLEDGKFYVIIGSRRDPVLAKGLLAELKVTQNVSLVKNSKKTWNHIILETAYTEAEAAKRVFELREGTFKDAWWTSSNRIIKE